MADDIDEGDVSHGSNYSYCLSSELNKLSRPYLVSGGIENGIQSTDVRNFVKIRIH